MNNFLPCFFSLQISMWVPWIHMDKLKDTVEKKKFVFISQSFVSDLSMHMGKESWRQSKGNAKIYSCRG
jgi:hypothetical protein